MSSSVIPPHVSSDIPSTPRSPRTRFPPGSSSGAGAPIRSSPVNGSPRTGAGGDGRGTPVGAADVESVLATYGGDATKALEALISDRTSLQQQNSQLWKLIEKQRVQCATLMHDNERIRADRERANQRLVEAGLAPVSSKRIPNSSSAVGLGLRAEAPAIRRHNSDREERQNNLEVPSGSNSASSTPHSSPNDHNQSGLLPSPMMGKASKRESRMAFTPEARALLAAMATTGSTPPPPIPPAVVPTTSTIPPTMNIPNITTTSPVSQYSPITAPDKPPAASTALEEVTEEPEQVDEPSTDEVPEDKPADPRIVLSRTLEQPRISSDRRPSLDEIMEARPSVDTHATSRQNGSSSRPLPQLSASLLPYTRLLIPRTSVHSNSAGRDILCFIVSITVRPPSAQPVSWEISKLFSSFVDLDMKLKTKSGKKSKEWAKTVAPLPDGKAWKDFAPSKIDQRRVALEGYLQSVLMAPLVDKSDLCLFLSTDPVQSRAAGFRKEGYLTKKVKGIGGGWKTRYFVLDGPNLECFEGRGGQRHSSILITGAQIGRQNKSSDAAEDRESRHAFLIIEQNKKGPIRHILCAESDSDRDSWIEALVRHVDPGVKVEPRHRSESARSNKDVVVTSAQPLSNVSGDSKFAVGPSPNMINSLESQRILNSSPSLASQSGHSHASMPPPAQPLSSPTSTTTPNLPDHLRQTKRQSSMPPRGPPQAHTAAYLSKLSADGMTAPPGVMPLDKDRDRKVKSGRFWPSFGKTATDKVSHPVFGVPLADSIAIAHVANLPAIVFRCIEYLEAKHAEQEEGLYRLSGSSAVIKGLKDRFDQEGDVKLKQNDEHWDPHAIAGLLKTFLRELPMGILTSDLHARFLAVMDLVDSAARVTELNRLVSELPPPNYALLRALTAHLILIVQNAEANKMTLRNIGIVFSPTLGIPAGIFSELVSGFGPIFDADPVPGEGEGHAESQARDDLAGEEEMTVKKRNSILYEQGGADALLGLRGRALDTVDDSPSDAEGSAESAEISVPSSGGHSDAVYDYDTTPRASTQPPVGLPVSTVPTHHPPRTASLPQSQG